MERLKRIRNLEYNWDGYNALPITDQVYKNCIFVVSCLIESVDIYPNTHGTISMRWECGEKVLNLEIGNSSMSYYVKLDSTVFVDDCEINPVEMEVLNNYIRCIK